MLCNEIRRLAYFYLDGTVGASKTERFEAHIDLCPDCGARLAIHRRVREVVRLSLEPVTAPERLRLRVRQACRGCE